MTLSNIYLSYYSPRVKSPKITVWQGCISLQSLWRRICSLPFPMSKVHCCSLAHGPNLQLQGQQKNTFKSLLLFLCLSPLLWSVHLISLWFHSDMSFFDSVPLASPIRTCVIILDFYTEKFVYPNILILIEPYIQVPFCHVSYPIHRFNGLGHGHFLENYLPYSGQYSNWQIFFTVPHAKYIHPIPMSSQVSTFNSVNSKFKISSKSH